MPPSVAEKRKAFEEEALAHLGSLYNVALRLVRDPANAEDLVQETVLKAYRAWDRYERGTNCRAWLLTILRNTFINDFRRRSRRPTTLSFESVQDFSIFPRILDEDPEGAFFGRIVDEEVRRAIDELPDEFRIPLVLSDLEGLSYAEIAQVLDLRIGTVKSRLFRARRRLQRRLHAYAVEMGYIST
jgi:RNA polymerase sigma-70 factor (ECF subfamily)